MQSTLITIRLTLATAGGVTAPEAQRFEEVRERDFEEVRERAETRVRNVLPIRRDPSGEPHLPGSTVAGSLRAHCESAGLSHLFGGAPDDQARSASAVQVLGTRLLTWQAPLVRTQTSIDRRRGAAAERTLHAVEQLPVGTAFDIVLRWDGASDADLAAFRRAVASWAPALGRGSSLGAGRCAVTGFGERTFDLGSVDGLIDWLGLGGPADYPQPAALPAGPSPVPVLRAVLFEIVDALHVGSGETDRGDDGHHVSRVVRSDAGFVLPGSSIKGVLRARAEYICRVLGVPACAGSTRPSCVESLPCRTCRLFGRGARAGGEGSRRALVAIPDAVIGGAEAECRRHVAIDRFTGGAREALLYTDEVLVRGRFRIVVEALGSGVEAADLALVDAVLTDLHDGLVGFGARTTAGYGTVRVVDPSWDPPEPARLAELLRETA